MAAVGKFEDMSGSRQMVGLYWWKFWGRIDRKIAKL
jgi:hypothetical protein